MAWISRFETFDLDEFESSYIVEYPINTRAWGEYSSLSEKNDSTSEKGVSFA